MAQWDVYSNPVSRSRDEIPFVVVLQSDLLDGLPTRLVAPLSRAPIVQMVLPRRLAPEFSVGGERVVLKPHEAGTLFARQLTQPIASLKTEASKIVDALETVISGV